MPWRWLVGLNREIILSDNSDRFARQQTAQSSPLQSGFPWASVKNLVRTVQYLYEVSWDSCFVKAGDEPSCLQFIESHFDVQKQDERCFLYCWTLKQCTFLGLWFWFPDSHTRTLLWQHITMTECVFCAVRAVSSTMPVPDGLRSVEIWPSGLRRGSAAYRLLGLRVRIPPGGMDVCLVWVLCVCQVEIPCPEQSYWLWCV
jgi:hypothetical protein